MVFYESIYVHTGCLCNVCWKCEDCDSGIFPVQATTVYIDGNYPVTAMKICGSYKISNKTGNGWIMFRWCDSRKSMVSMRLRECPVQYHVQTHDNVEATAELSTEHVGRLVYVVLVSTRP